MRFDGRILFLTEDADLVRRQLAGEDLAWEANDASHALRDEISTDEIAPGWVCFHHDETLGRFAYLGVTCADGGTRATPFVEDAVRAGGFAVSVAGRRRGKGSSREQAPYAERAAGIRLLVAETFERIYRQNAINLGMLVTNDFSVLDRVRRGEDIPLAFFTDGEDAVTRGVIESGGLLPYTRRRLAGAVAAPVLGAPARAMTLAEKILARHAVTDAAGGAAGVERRGAGGRRLRAGRLAFLARVRDAHGGERVREGARRKRARRRTARASSSSATTSCSSARSCPRSGRAAASSRSPRASRSGRRSSRARRA